MCLALSKTFVPYLKQTIFHVQSDATWQYIKHLLKIQLTILNNHHSNHQQLLLPRQAISDAHILY